MKRLLGIVVLSFLWCSPSYAEFVMQDLISVLIETKKIKSIEVAKHLQSITSTDKTYELVIRNSNLSLEDAKNIAEAIDKVSKNDGPKLSTLSLSFNQDLKDEGVIEILSKIPKTTPVIAFVECGITDKAGQAIIDWALENKEINGIYIEGNTFSSSMEAKFEKLRVNNPQLTILSKWASEEFKEMVKKTFN
ncbi:hypothetical protein [Marinomonas primoryensis]|jgi:hypothetical protein|uniref:hypothetical protein n=1 Tax=Marinomonas primoryensis TaxID=178399 RepID=UPI003704B64A